MDDEDLDYHPVDSLESEDETSAVTNEEISDEA